MSFDIDSVDSAEFQSTGTPEGEGLTVKFSKALFEKFIPRSHGMDFTEVNYELAPNEQVRQQDEATFQDIF